MLLLIVGIIMAFAGAMLTTQPLHERGWSMRQILLLRCGIYAIALAIALVLR
jgi:hypothetical protein